MSEKAQTKKSKKYKKWYQKKYQVLFIDEYNNITEIGWYDDLKDAEKDLNGHLSLYTYVDEEGRETNEICAFGKNKCLGHLKEYPSTFGPVFDKIIDVPEGSVQVRGFVRY